MSIWKKLKGPALWPAMFCLGGIIATPAWADLMLFPTRVVIDGNARSSQVEIVNRDNKPTSYRISIVNRKMTDNGELVELTTDEDKAAVADNLIFYTPRLVTLQPGTSQIVRIAIRKPAGLADGEYRSHLQFDRLPDMDDGSDIEAQSAATKAGVATIRLTALIGASIPVIVRQGQTQASVMIDGMALEPGTGGGAPALKFDMHRTGNRSVYGDLTANFEPMSGKPIELGTVGGVAVYVPNSIRHARLSLNVPAGVDLKQGSIVLRYAERPDAGGATLAEGKLQLP